ncbi:MAG TPA: biotin carboxylase N-terminal domain-containing protein, partial [Caulobacteraceae bacterium]|nr:biotin carboxylase N-terminal domain-containing protein [Caulobacteraceae bacterium]
MGLSAVLIANRGEIAIRVARAAAGLGLRSAAVFSEDDARSLHVRIADEAAPLKGAGARAYLDGAAIIEAARATGCDAVHPGYGFLSESAEFARACQAAGLTFIGPRPEALALFGDKARARALARQCGVPIARGTETVTSLEQARAAFEGLGGRAMMIKAIAGGGGRGMRLVREVAELEPAFERCASEALAAFGEGGLYVEEVVEPARHIEVQVLADRTGGLIHLWDRDCSLQRRRQKLVEFAPSPNLSPGARERVIEAALSLARAAEYDSLGTFEFLVEPDERFIFIEANARLQVEHTVTEEVTGVDLVQAQIQVAAGRSLAELGLAETPPLIGRAVQLRVNTETMDKTGEVRPTGGALEAFEPPSGPGVRVDACGYAGYTTNPNFDSLLAKVIVHERSGRPDALAAKAVRALEEFRLEGVQTNIPILRALLRRDDVRAGQLSTRLVEDHISELLARAPAHDRFFDDAAVGKIQAPVAGPAAPEGTVALGAPTQGLLVAVNVSEGDRVRPGQAVAVLEAMKMEHLVEARQAGVVRQIPGVVGQTLFEGAPIVFIEPADHQGEADEAAAAIDLDHLRPDLV